MSWIAIATWKFGETAARAAAPLLAAGRPALDAAIAGAQAVEDDPAVNSVGFGGLGDATGRVTLDAAVMDGATLRCGAVAGVENVRHVASLARRVMESTPHLLLVGRGAEQFALDEGFPRETLLTPQSVQQWLKTRPQPGDGPQRLPDPARDHDTITVLARDSWGRLAGACSTSGLAHKLPGRVGDSPIIGHGLYVDDTAGAAGGTGVGEEIMRVVGSFFITEQMRAGLSAQAACDAACRRVIAAAARRGAPVARVAFLALDLAGNPGAACTPGTEFFMAAARPSGIDVTPVAIVTDAS
jgi:isoaspartyl peptidase/L-asparaginase-like protein (Ntn-hydrolase superfamily)